MLENEDFVTWANENVVTVVGHDGATGENKQHEPVEEKDAKTKEVRQVCPLYEGLTCEEHRNIRREASNPKDDFGKIEIPSGYPNSWMIGPDGVVERIEGKDQQTAGKLEELLTEFQKKYEGKPLAMKKYEAYRKAFAAGDEAIEAGKWRAALAAYAKVDADAKKLPAGMADRVKAKIDAANERIAAKFAEVRDGDLDDAAKLKAVKALRSEVGAKFSTGFLPVLAELDAWTKEQSAALASKK